MKKTIFIFLPCLLLTMACHKEGPLQPDWNQIPNPNAIEGDYPKPAPCNNNIVAHMGGGTEAGLPVNSLAAVRYALNLEVFAVELDAYWTKDDNIIIGHANSIGQIGNLTPSEYTLEQIKSGVRLSNGERLPSLGEVLDVIMTEGKCTKLAIDIKKIDYPTDKPELVINATKAICRIINEKRAKNYVILLCTGYNANAMKQSWSLAQQNELEIAMNSGKDATTFRNLGFNWINIAATAMTSESGGTGTRSLKEYTDAGITVSVYNIDKQSGDGNAVWSSEALNYYKKNYKLFKMLSTNYPAWLKENLGTL